MHRPVLILAGILLAPSVAFAQRSSPAYVGAGSTVRVTAPSVLPERMTGTFISAFGDTIRVAGRGGNLHFALPFPAVQRLEVSSGRERMKWMWIGAGAGAIIGPVVGGIMAKGGNTQDAEAWGRLGGLVIGAPIGAIAGAVLAPERWRDVMLSSLR
ncbi:MAG: hypothetical protein H0X64_06910 [Gemmatimonadaceae bacterium]|nr:hypothetical protein [Gemmatimonadaceae bacterium]